MESYIGTKQINATPMTRLAYNDLRGWQLPKDENGSDEGYLVEYPDSPNKNMEGYGGYISWSPKTEFDKAYRLTDGMNFGLAIEALRLGKRVARSGWNGKGMWLSLSCGLIDGDNNGNREVAAEHFWSKHNAEFAAQNGGEATVLPSITMKTATGEILMGWLASQTDMLASDWVIV